MHFLLSHFTNNKRKIRAKRTKNVENIFIVDDKKRKTKNCEDG
jgi:hypothetical protein